MPSTGAMERALFVGGPLHGTERMVNRPTVVTWEWDHALPPWEAPPPAQVTYTRQIVCLELPNGDRYQRPVWVHGLDLEAPESMERVAHAALCLWMAAGTKLPAVSA